MAFDSTMAGRLLSFILMLSFFGHALAKCNSCEGESKIACYNRTAFSICVDGETIEDFIMCPSGYHCTNGYLICYLENQGHADCDSTTTPRTPLDAKTFCKDKEPVYYPNTDDPTCKTYYNCENPLMPRLITCPDNTYYSEENEYCSLDRPIRCIE